jgi:serine/threonine protein kinase
LTGYQLPKTKKGYADFENFCWNGISPDAQDLIKKMLHDDPKERILIHEVLKHPWLNDIHKPTLPEKNNHTPTINKIISKEIPKASSCKYCHKKNTENINIKSNENTIN